MPRIHTRPSRPAFPSGLRSVALAAVQITAVLLTGGAPAQEAGSAGEAAEGREPRAERDLHAPWDQLLGAYVVGERIDYLGLAAGPGREDLDAYLDELAAVEPARLGRDDRLAFYLNLYNASMVRAVLARYRLGWTPAADDFAVFGAPVVGLDGETVSLDHLEHEIVRKQFDEPRIHVALVCGAVSCPPILGRAWRGKDLDRTLEARMQEFLQDPERNRIGRDEAELSKIFEWFRGDFEAGDRSLVDYLRAHGAPRLRRDAELRFREYDWSLNIAFRDTGAWRVVTRDGVLPKDTVVRLLGAPPASKVEDGKAGGQKVPVETVAGRRVEVSGSRLGPFPVPDEALRRKG